MSYTKEGYFLKKLKADSKSDTIWNDMQDVHGFGDPHYGYIWIQSTKTLTGNVGANRLKFND